MPTVLRDVYGLPYQEIAAVTGRPLGTVKVMVHRGRACLRLRLRPNEDGLMDCSYFHRRITDYLDGELGYLESAELERHLGSCEGCAAELAEASVVRGALAAWGSIELAPPPGFAQRVIAAVEREPDAAARPFQRAVDGRLREIDGLLGRVALPGGRSMLVRNLIGWGLAAAAVLIGIERRHVRHSRELRPS